jgi:hypothetical protein
METVLCLECRRIKPDKIKPGKSNQAKLSQAKPSQARLLGEGHGWCYYFGHLCEMTSDRQ